MFQRWFFEHPQSVGESYFEHQRAATGFAASLGRAAVLCLIHGLVPGLFQHSASRAVAELNQQMSRRSASANRNQHAAG